MRNIRKIIILIVAIGVVLFSYGTNQKRLIKDFTDTALSAKIQIDQYAKLSSDFIDMMGAYGTEYFKNKHVEESPYYDALTYDPSWGGYSLDKASSLGYERFVGNLTGEGSIPMEGELKKEVILALNYNTYFNSFYKSLPGVAWIYYTSESGFMNLYPWVNSKEVKYVKDVQKNEYMVDGRYQGNLRGDRYWSNIYLDTVGKGLMITVSRSIYSGDVFKGVVSLDFTLDQLSKLLPLKNPYLVSENNEILATNEKSERLLSKVYTMDTIFDELSKDEIEKLKNISENEVVPFHHGYAYMLKFYDVPWRLYYILPNSSIMMEALLASFPVLIIAVLLFLITSEAEARKKIELQLEKTATLDFLTGVVNRRGVLKRLEEEEEYFKRKGSPFSFVMMDIDHFKYFNDKYGHRAGDVILVKVCEILSANVRASDVVCRWGGEEFLAVIFDTTYKQTLEIAEKLRVEIEKMKVPWEGGLELSITMTFGVNQYNSEDGLEISISHADSALYQGKERGRNQVVGYNESSHLNT